MYGYYSKGFRSGSFNMRLRRARVLPSGALALQLPVDKEEADTVEFGVKSRFNEARTTLNAAVFYSEIQDLQKEVNAGIDAGGATQTSLNTADAEMKGIELELVHELIDGLIFNGSLGYIDAKYTDVFFDLNADRVLDSRDEDLDLTRTPEWTAAAALTYEASLGDRGSILSRLAYSYRDELFHNDSNDIPVPSLALIDVSIGYYPPSDRWSATVYGKNLTNDENIAFCSALPSPPFRASGFCPINDGRVVGVEVEFNFQ
jgi:iron complex outermembrane receptor protein